MNRRPVAALPLIGVLGTFGLTAALHHVVVLTAHGTTLSNAFAGTCSACHGGKYSNFGKIEPD
jgi:uncharacterized membrane protein YjjB (DUF3815 family)